MESPSTCTQCGTPMRADDRFCPSCGTGRRGTTVVGAGTGGSWQAILDRLSESTAPRYRVLRLLGYGGMAGVYLAEEPRLGRRVAIKVMSPALMIDPGLVNRFEQEARTTAQLHHPNIVTIYDVDERGGLHYFVMAYVPGRTLAQVMTRAEGALPVRAVAHWLSQVGTALDYAHRAGVVHRDVKPGNILFDADANALVTDFGIAKVADEPSLTKTGMLVGTPAYMSPEQCTSGVVAGASDQYALGIVAYEMLAGRPPFTGQTVAVLHAHVHEPPPPLLEFRPDCPPELAAVVERMLSKRQESRFPSIADAVAAVAAPSLRHDDPERDRMISIVAPDEGFTPVSTRPVSPAPGTRTPAGSGTTDPERTPPHAAPATPTAAVPPTRATPPHEPAPSFAATTPAEPTAGPAAPTPPAYPTPGATSPLATPAYPTPSGSTPAGPTKTSVRASTDAPRRRRPLALAAAAVLVIAAVAAGAAVLSGGGDDDDAGDGTGVSSAAGDGAVAPPLGAGPTQVTDGDSTAAGGSNTAADAGTRATTVAGPDATAAARGGQAQDAPTAGRTGQTEAPRQGRQAQTPPATTDPVVEAPPRQGTLRVAGTLPAGTQIFVSGPGQPRRRLDGRAVELQPGSYTVEATADGYQPVQATLDVASGETASWSPTLVAVPPPQRPANDPPRDPPAAAYDQAQAAQQIHAAIRAFVDAWETRSMDRVVAAYPGATADWRRTFGQFVENTSDVKELTTTAQNLSAPTFAGDTARVSFVLAANYRDIRNQEQQPQFRFDARLRRTPDGWRLEELIQNR